MSPIRRRVFAPAHHEWRPERGGSGVEANRRTLEGMARSAGSASAQEAAAAGVGRGALGSGSGVSPQEARSVTNGGIHQEHQALNCAVAMRQERQCRSQAKGALSPAHRFRARPSHKSDEADVCRAGFQISQCTNQPPGRLTSAANARDPQLPGERLTVPWRSWGRDTMLSARPR